MVRSSAGWADDGMRTAYNAVDGGDDSGVVWDLCAFSSIP